MAADAGRPSPLFSVAFGPARLHSALGLSIMTLSKILVLAAVGTWFLIALSLGIVLSLETHTFPLLLAVPFLAIPEMVAPGMRSGWVWAFACCIAVAWLVAGVEVWRRPKPVLAGCLFAAWTALVVIGYYWGWRGVHDL